MSPTIEKFIRIKAKPDALLKHLAWIEALPGVTVWVQSQPDDPNVSVLHVVAPLDQGQNEDVDQIVRHWERENPGTLMTDWLEEGDED